MKEKRVRVWNKKREKKRGRKKKKSKELTKFVRNASPHLLQKIEGSKVQGSV